MPPFAHNQYRRVPPHRYDVGRSRQRYLGRPSWRGYGSYYGLPPVLLGAPSLQFLDDGLLIGSYVDHGVTVYVYLIEVNGTPTEYSVDGFGNIVSARPIR